MKNSINSISNDTSFDLETIEVFLNRFDSIEFSLYNDHLSYRFNPKFIFKGKSIFMIGFNRWNDIEKSRHKIYDAFIMDYSLSQIIQFSPYNKKSFLFGTGIIENMYYIYSKGIEFQVGIIFQIGIRI